MNKINRFTSEERQKAYCGFCDWLTKNAGPDAVHCFMIIFVIEVYSNIPESQLTPQNKIDLGRAKHGLRRALKWLEEEKKRPPKISGILS
ncbi:MAG: hypothetical protein ABSG01_10040 [Anaerolineales bacterium]|jgi:hypothetical protein